jgi:predicted metal-dependent hydrolase
MTVSHVTWPPTYVLKKHSRARHVKLKFSADKGLEIVVPPRFNQKEIPGILLKHKAWLAKQFDAWESVIAERQNPSLPTEINLAAIGELWQISYQPMAAKLQLIIRPERELVLLGDINNKPACQQILIKWLRKRANLYLAQRLHKLSIATNLAYSDVTIRAQTTRWGSCTADKKISLNYKLLLMSTALADHIMIHELCHTQHLNHSSRFWDLVASHDRNWQEHRQLLRASEKNIPLWLR